MIRDLFVPLTGMPTDAKAVAAAIALARQSGAHVCVAQPLFIPAVAVPEAPTLADVYAEYREQTNRNADRFRQLLTREGIAHEVRLAESVLMEPPGTAAMQARHADLAVVAAAGDQRGGDSGELRRYFAALLFESGRPVLAVPTQASFEWPPAHAVVAWKPNRETARALHDAIPLLRLAGSVDVVAVDPKTDEFHYGDMPGADIATHLARHDLAVNVVELPREGQAVSTVLLRHCDESGAQLLVAGGFGHTRLREWVLGGATRELLQHTRVPILFSH